MPGPAAAVVDAVVRDGDPDGDPDSAVPPPATAAAAAPTTAPMVEASRAVTATEPTLVSVLLRIEAMVSTAMRFCAVAPPPESATPPVPPAASEIAAATDMAWIEACSLAVTPTAPVADSEVTPSM